MRGMTLTTLMIPEEAYVVALVVAGMLIIVGLRRIGFALLAFILLSALLTPFIEPLVAALPVWAVWVLLIVFVLWLVRLMMGRRIWDNMWGAIFANLVTWLVVSLFRWPFRLLGGLFRWLGSR